MTKQKLNKNSGYYVGNIRRKNDPAPKGKFMKSNAVGGLAAWLRSCPAKGFFVPFDFKDTTDDIRSWFD